MKRKIAKIYQKNFTNSKYISSISENYMCKSNYWLNAIYIDKSNLQIRNKILDTLNSKKIHCRPAWKLMHTLPMFKKNPRSNLDSAIDLEKKILCLPSSPYLA